MRQISDGVVSVLEAAEAAAGGRGRKTDGVWARAMRRHRHVFQHAYRALEQTRWLQLTQMPSISKITNLSKN